MTPTDHALLAAAERVPAAEQQLTAARVALRDAELARDKIAARIRELDEARTAIIARRQRGETRDDDGAVLELNRADHEGLVELLSQSEASVTAAQGSVQAASQALEMARHAFTRLEAERAEDALRQRAEELAALLAACIDELRAERGKLGGGRIAWTPSRSLMDRLVPLDLGRAW
ncbi:hypothetical protein [Paracraurococcus lichenis]|uniref:Uncharacterized protein n=1 Tax=Paracraurococcus lichenis TaxID=3064888 RepID=A0ABT9EC41_9PROT|nr:hypothetical protein [Paracraurococcus sp. LOR1-02]MDO9713781.1 hypothetical protein [Paracraurococcus sp. LOR1-02]